MKQYVCLSAERIDAGIKEFININKDFNNE